MLDKIMNMITLGPLKGSRSKIGLLVAAVALLLEHFGVVSPGTLTDDKLKIVWTILQSYFVIEHFEGK